MVSIRKRFRLVIVGNETGSRTPLEWMRYRRRDDAERRAQWMNARYALAREDGEPDDPLVHYEVEKYR